MVGAKKRGQFVHQFFHGQKQAGAGAVAAKIERHKLGQFGNFVLQFAAVVTAGLDDGVAGFGAVHVGQHVIIAEDEQLAAAPHQAAKGAGGHFKMGQRHAGRNLAAPAVFGRLRLPGQKFAGFNDIGFNAVQIAGNFVAFGQLGFGHFLDHIDHHRHVVGEAIAGFFVTHAHTDHVTAGDQLAQILLLH